MDRVERYREIVSRLIEEYASPKPSNGEIETMKVPRRRFSLRTLVRIEQPRSAEGCAVPELQLERKGSLEATS